MTKIPNIIQRRELEPLMLKADKIAKYYEKAANCQVCLIGPHPPDCCNNGKNAIHFLCRHCNKKKDFYEKHMEAVCEAKRLGGSFIYVCPSNIVFWTSPFYSGERFAGALISGCNHGSTKNSEKVKALANMMQICADQISKGGSRGKDSLLYLKTNHLYSVSFSSKTDFALKGTDSYTENETSEKAYRPKNIHKPEKNNSNSELSRTTPQSAQSGSDNSSLIDMERMLFAHLRRGDTVEGKKVLMKLLDVYLQREKCSLPSFQLKAMELMVLLSRAVSNPNDLNDNTVLETNDRYLNKIKDSSSYQEITETLINFLEKISGRIFSFQGVRHFPVLRKAERYIWENYTRKLSLEEIAGISGLSAPYFSTIFREEMGENLSNYLNRLRVEKAALMLITTTMAINKIASVCGFNDQSWFSKIFKTTFGITPGKYRDQGNIADHPCNGVSI